MSKDQLELSPEVQTLSRILSSLGQKMVAIDWYTQQLNLEEDLEAKKVLAYARLEEFKQFGIALEFLLRKYPQMREFLHFGEDDMVNPDFTEFLFMEHEKPGSDPSLGLDPDQLMKEFLS
jgi:hypothetical protein